MCREPRQSSDANVYGLAVVQLPCMAPEFPVAWPLNVGTVASRFHCTFLLSLRCSGCLLGSPASSCLKTAPFGVRKGWYGLGGCVQRSCVLRRTELMERSDSGLPAPARDETARHSSLPQLQCNDYRDLQSKASENVECYVAGRPG